MSDEQNSADLIRLNKHLALQLGVSRREADELIEKGRVTINGDTAVLGARIHPDDTVTANGQPVSEKTPLQYVALNKPVGYVCSRKAQGDNPTIYSFLPPKMSVLKPVGRLDKDSSGLLLLTNDGDFAFRMTHPKFAKTKIYEVQLDHPLEPLHQQMISDYGVQLDDGISKFTVMRLEDREKTTYQVTMKEGRNRQIRRTFSALGYEVTVLHRVQFGNYSLGDMKTKHFAFVDMR
ncbi:MAG TPA: pseudouridine synthase [Candidatus Saccharimonadales bacterium]